MKTGMTTTSRLAASALLIFTCALFALGAQWPAFSHLRHPVAFAGMQGVVGALLFNTMVFVLPGLLVAIVALRLRLALPAQAGWWSRIGMGLLLISALAFAMQGVLVLDPEHLDAGSSRWHASAWMVWLIAFAAGTALAATAMGRAHVSMRVLAMVVLLLALLGAMVLPVGVAQRLAFVGWFGWFWLAARAISRDGVSAPG